MDSSLNPEPIIRSHFVQNRIIDRDFIHEIMIWVEQKRFEKFSNLNVDRFSIDTKNDHSLEYHTILFGE